MSQCQFSACGVSRGLLQLVSGRAATRGRMSLQLVHDPSCHLPPAHAQLRSLLSVSPCTLQASSGVKQWNKRWFVLVDRCLFYYKGELVPGQVGAVGSQGSPFFSILPESWALLWMEVGLGHTCPLQSLSPVGMSQWDKDKAHFLIHSLTHIQYILSAYWVSGTVLGPAW